jgi:hypothetical protein
VSVFQVTQHCPLCEAWAKKCEEKDAEIERLWERIRQLGAASHERLEQAREQVRRLREGITHGIIGLEQLVTNVDGEDGSACWCPPTHNHISTGFHHPHCRQAKRSGMEMKKALATTEEE